MGGVGALELNRMSTSQPLSDPAPLPLIESVLGASPEVVLTRPTQDADEQIIAWKAHEERLAAWTPASGEPDVRADEDGYVLPGHKTVAVALQIAARLREAGVCAPFRTGQTANGGINFEWRSGNRTQRLTVNSRGETELARFEDSNLIFREPVSLA